MSRCPKISSRRLPCRTRRRSIRLLLLGLGLWITATTPLDAASLALSDGSGPIDFLAIGHHLVVGGQGLPVDLPVILELRDWDGNEIVSGSATTGPGGELDDTLLWVRTGIGGCDCEQLPHGYPFEDANQAALELLGRSLDVVVRDAAGSILVTESLMVDWGPEPVVYLTDVDLCPRSILDQNDDGFLVTTRVATEAVRVFLVPHRPAWQVGDALADVRPGFPQGQLLEPTGSTWLEPLWLGVESLPGGYDLVIRPGMSASQVLGPSDEVRNQPIGIPKPLLSEGGLVIDDWDCRSHDDQ